jgi:hypothetical protein
MTIYNTEYIAECPNLVDGNLVQIAWLLFVQFPSPPWHVLLQYPPAPPSLSQLLS